jgi:hypothetical protein
VPTGSVGTKDLEMTIRVGPEGNLVKASSCGYAKLVLLPTKTTNFAISVNRSMSTLVIMLTLMAKNGSSVSNVTSGFIVTVKCKMVILT